MSSLGPGILVLILVAFYILANSIRILKEYERGVVFRLGRLVGVKGPGLILLIPIVDKKNNELIIKPLGFSTKGDWEKLVREEKLQLVRVEIKGPSLPLRVNISEGKIQIKNWINGFAISQKKGKIHSK